MSGRNLGCWDDSKRMETLGVVLKVQFDAAYRTYNLNQRDYVIQRVSFISDLYSKE
jgi:hypothetical protein